MIEVTGAADDLTPSGDLLWAIWPGAGRWDPRRRPLALAKSWGGRLVLDYPGLCTEPDLDVGAAIRANRRARGDRPGPRDSLLALRIAPVDQAGNVGAVERIVIDLDRVEPAW
jgi:hypothetical protein